MATPRSLLLIVLFGLVCSIATVVRADEGIPPSYEYGNEIVALKSKLSLLEEGLKNKELSLSEKESKISKLEQELDALRTRKEETEDTKLAQLKIDSAMSKVRELESQVKSLEEEADKLRVEADLHANRAKTVEDTATSHLTEKEKAIKALEDQKLRLQKAERGLQIAEAAMLKAKAEAEEKAKKLDDLHQSWLPPWAATHAETLTKTASDRWSTHADPVVKNFQRSASSKAADAHEYIKPHLDTFHTKVNPLIKEKWQKLAAAAAPHLETVKKAGVSSREYIAPHVETVQKTVNPYVEAVKVKSKPYVDQAKTFAAPHLERVDTLAGPHYRRVLTAANSYHEQVQSHLKEKLGQYKFLSSIATNEFIWFLAAALLALPFVTVFMFLRSLFVPKQVVHHKRHRSSHSGSSSTSKKPRRSRQADKQEQK
ncbi:hypothetical protein M758_7G127000 [Ceratodon purpureus]|nr:hypothetical protein M758_7G127000 [Ceratodon purpureus]